MLVSFEDQCRGTAAALPAVVEPRCGAQPLPGLYAVRGERVGRRDVGVAVARAVCPEHRRTGRSQQQSTSERVRQSCLYGSAWHPLRAQALQPSESRSGGGPVWWLELTATRVG